MHVGTGWFWIVVVLFIGLVMYGIPGSVDVTPLEATGAKASTVAINGNPGVILEAESYRRGADGWYPSEEHLQGAEDAVLAAPMGHREPIYDGYRQYTGIVEDGQRKVVINSTCVMFDRWDREWILVMDGGPCFWEAIYNVDTGEVETLIVNGQA